MVFTVFKQNKDLYNGKNNPLKFNEPPTLDHVRTLFGIPTTTVFLRNTLFVAVLSRSSRS